MFRIMFSLVFCLGFAGSGYAFFEELFERLENETAKLAHVVEIFAKNYEAKHQEHKNGLPEALAKELDKGLHTLKLLLENAIKKIKQNTMFPEEFRNKVLARLVAIQNKFFRRIDEIQKKLDEEKSGVEEKVADL